MGFGLLSKNVSTKHRIKSHVPYIECNEFYKKKNYNTFSV